MEAKFKRAIQSGGEYNRFFPRAYGQDIEIKKEANVSDTVALIPKVVYDTLPDTIPLAKHLKGNTLYETCENIWDFVYHHIQYAQDKEGVEQIRRPARTWMDRARGVDCDCYTVFISSILTNLQIPHTYRITKYKHRDYFQHIYPIVPTANGKYITIDCVVNEFNYEEPYTEKKDTIMKLHYLNGLDAEQTKSLMTMDNNVDALELMGMEDDFDGIGKINFSKIKEGAKRALHVVNRLNPATGLLRAGVLASMKLNLMKIAGRIRYAYLTDEEVNAKGLDVGKVNKLRTILKKLEDVFYSGGGKKENLKKAILTGKGNKDHEVNGLGYVADGYEYNDNTPLSVLLSGMYEEEVMEGLGGLGEPITGAAIAAASSAMAIIAGLIKKVGGVKKGGGDAPAGEEGSASEGGTIDNESISDNNNGSANRSANRGTNTNSSGSNTDAGSGANSEGFMAKTKTWVKEHPMQAGAVALTAGTLIFFGVKHFTKPKANSKQTALSGVPHHKKGRKKKGKRKTKHSHHKRHKTPIALL